MENEEKDLSSGPEVNDFIPDPNAPDGPEVQQNDAIPADYKRKDPNYSKKIIAKISENNIARVGENFALQREYLHGEGQAGGEQFRLTDGSGREVIVTLAQIAGVTSESDLQELLEEDGQS